MIEYQGLPVEASLGKHTLAAWYALDRRANNTTRRCRSYYTDLMREIGVQRRTIFAVVATLKRRELVRVDRNLAPHGGMDASEFLVMPANPRKRLKVLGVADAIGQDPLSTLDYIAQYETLRATRHDIDWDAVTLRDLALWIDYVDGTPHPYVGRLLDAMRFNGFLDDNGNVVW